MSLSNCIDLRQTKTKVIIGPFYTHRQLHFTSINVPVL